VIAAVAATAARKDPAGQWSPRWPRPPSQGPGGRPSAARTSPGRGQGAGQRRGL